MQNIVFDQKFITDTSSRIAETADRAVFDASAWDDFVEQLGGALPGTCIMLQRFNLRRNRVDYDRVLNIDPDDEASYRQYYCSLNPWVQPMRSVPSGTVMVSERDCPSGSFSHTEFYDWLPAELRAGAAIILEASGDNLAAVGVHYGVNRAGNYDQPVSELLRGIARPLLRSVEAARLFERTLDRERSAAAIVSRSGDIACVIDDRLRVVEANALAESEFQRRKVLSTRAGKFCVLASDINAWLADTLRLLAADLEPDATTRVFFAHGAHQIAVARLPAGSGFRNPFSGSPLFLLIVRNLSVPSEAGTMAALTTAFGLTPAEQRLCEALLLGHSTKEAADMLGIASETARQRLKAIFQKTDTRRQSELIALLGRLL
ncbi:helix-turn-helix transcriptional regulator [Mesorhizobium comanense]|uniref:helix-turn-helix transcriptional regulator n=1 Tax=Mesorhizobium comanense TaxID=2502215 RepID=UPI0010F726FD|nr:helix-turn-helix transcriptional regulator [Mesorhizobium comanense]